MQGAVSLSKNSEYSIPTNHTPNSEPGTRNPEQDSCQPSAASAKIITPVSDAQDVATQVRDGPSLVGPIAQLG